MEVCNEKIREVNDCSCVPFSVICFGTIEKLYSFYSSSTLRWELLKDKTGESVKCLSDNRWSTHGNSTKAVTVNVEPIVSTLEDM